MQRRISLDHLIRSRITKVIIVLILAYAALIVRLAYIQIYQAEHYKTLAKDMTSRAIPLPARRGTIYDREMNKLAITVDAYNIYAHPNRIANKESTAAKLAPIIGWSKQRLLSRIQNDSKFVYLIRRADVELGDKVKAAKMPGIGVESVTKRVYLGGSLSAHIIGFTDVDGKGIEGLEKALDRELRGADGYMNAEVDANGRIIPGTIRERVEPIHGKDIVLTIDSTLQHALEVELARTFKTYKAKGASAVILYPSTGEILALANMPTFDPNNVRESSADDRRNRAITDLYEPGSTLKAITACAALESGKISPGFTVNCKGSMKVGRRTIRCSLHGDEFKNGHGVSNIAKILKHSCNVGAANIGLKLGKEKLYEYEKAFGMYEKPGTQMIGEAGGMHTKWQDWPDVQVANIAFGQGIAVSPLQVARSYGTIANGGLMLRPFVVKEILNADGSIYKTFGPKVVRRVVSDETAGLIAQMLTGVVVEGTGKTAQVEGYTVAGKTGSAQKVVDGRYAPGKYVASFVGFLPVNDPKVVILVAVDEPKGAHWGATVAAPVFQQAAQKAMWKLKVPPNNNGRRPSPMADKSTKKENHPPDVKYNQTAQG